MMEVPFSDLASAIATPTHRPVGHRLTVADMPMPFVAPAFVRRNDEDAFKEVILIKASAAVGKTTLARALSATNSIPILDLSRIPVSTGSLKALLLDLRNGADPVASFHSAHLPIVIDALDEGRLLSGEKGFESFLETAAELVLEDRSNVNFPKLILLGRYESIELAEIAFSSAGIPYVILDVGFFDEASARNLIRAYGDAAAEAGCAYLIHGKPVKELVDAYFSKIGQALGLANGALWQEERGRAFAGYAPVLAAIGSLLPAIENFADALNRINASGAQDAWDVIETVLGEILLRERGKLTDKLQLQIVTDLPASVYGADEQLSYLIQFIQKKPLEGKNLKLAPQDDAKYKLLVQQIIGEHPFIRQSKFSNDVIASFVVANALKNDWDVDSASELVVSLSRQPFLWRSLAHIVDESDLLDGKYLGYLLNSYWTDPLNKNGSVAIRSSETGSALIRLQQPSWLQTSQFRMTTPLVLQGAAKKLDVDIEGALSMEGLGALGNSVFNIEDSSITVTGLSFNCNRLRCSGDVWLQADSQTSLPQMALVIADGASVGWGELFTKVYPWNRHQPANKNEASKKIDVASLLAAEFAARFRGGASVILNTDFTPPENDVYTGWASRKYTESFPLYISLLLKHGLVFSEPFAASGDSKIRIRPNLNWDAVAETVLSPDRHPEYRQFYEDVAVQLVSTE